MGLPRLIPVEELFADPQFAGASISKDGTKLAYLAPNHGRTQVWVRGIDEDHDAAICLTNDTRRGIRQYFWTDSPRWFLYLQDTDGNEDWHLWRVDLDSILKDGPGAPAVDLTPMAAGTRVQNVEQMKGVAGHVLVSMNERPMYFDTFKINIETGERTLVCEQPELRENYIVAADGSANFLSKLCDDGVTEFYAVEADGSRRLLQRIGGLEFPVGIYPTKVAADGQTLLLGIHNARDELHLARLDLNGEITPVAELEGHDLCFMGYVLPVYPPTMLFSRKTGDVIAARFVGDRPIIKPLTPHFEEVFAELSKLSDGVLAGATSDETETKWVATFVNDVEPGLCFFYDHSTGESRLLFRPYPQLARDELAPMQHIQYTARDGLEIHGFLTLPVGIDPVGLPLVLKVHGGPWTHDQWCYDSGAQLLANRGIAVLQVNFRGSSGYGKQHTLLAKGQLAGTMHDDLIDAADWAVKQGYADPSRIGIFGGSYGGYAALVAVTFTPDYFAAAVDFCGISNLANFMRTLPPFTRPTMITNWYGYVGDPDVPEQYDDMMARSPITKVDQIRTPLLVAQGAMDARVVQAEADNIVAELRSRNVPVDYLLKEDEGHGFQNPENTMDLWRAIEKHFGTYLGGRTAE